MPIVEITVYGEMDPHTGALPAWPDPSVRHTMLINTDQVRRVYRIWDWEQRGFLAHWLVELVDEHPQRTERRTTYVTTKQEGYDPIKNGKPASVKS